MFSNRKSYNFLDVRKVDESICTYNADNIVKFCKEGDESVMYVKDILSNKDVMDTTLNKLLSQSDIDNDPEGKVIIDTLKASINNTYTETIQRVVLSDRWFNEFTDGVYK